MPKKPELLVIDTNLWISFLISGTFSKLDKILTSGFARLIFSSELLEEFMQVAERPKFKKIFSASEITSILRDIHRYADFIDVSTTVIECRDEKDNFLLALSKDGKADFLLTGDEDLLTLKKFGNVQIMLMTEYLERFNRISMKTT